MLIKSLGRVCSSEEKKRREERAGRKEGVYTDGLGHTPFSSDEERVPIEGQSQQPPNPC